MLLETTAEIFAANRAMGRVSLNAKFAEGATRRGRVHEQGGLRVRCPGPPAPELEAMIVNTAGGMAGGDVCELNFAVGPGARLLVTSAAAEKIYRTLGAETSIPAASSPGCHRKPSCSIGRGCDGRSRSISPPMRACCSPRR
jgi:urease accessory protein